MVHTPKKVGSSPRNDGVNYRYKILPVSFIMKKKNTAPQRVKFHGMIELF